MFEDMDEVFACFCYSHHPIQTQTMIFNSNGRYDKESSLMQKGTGPEYYLEKFYVRWMDAAEI